MMIRSKVIVIFVSNIEIQAFGIILVQSVILLLIPNVFLDNFHFSKMGSHFLFIITLILIILKFLGRSRASVNALVMESFVKKKFSSVKTLHATILSTTNTNAVGVTKPKALSEQSNEGLKAHCDGCGELLSAPCFTCIHCNYHLHKQCVEAPLQIPNHPLHPKHSDTVFLLRRRPYPNNDMFSQLSKHDIHQHPLTFIESPTIIDVPKRFNCSWCHEPLIDAIYLCPDCPFIIHEKCLDELPTEIDHLTHRLHPLILNHSDSDYLCNLCQEQHSGPYYGCSLCHFNINVECDWLRSIVEDKSCHQHPLTLFWRQDSSICDACGTEGNYISYICSTCCTTVHKKCISLPHIIKFSRHDHCIFHKHFLQTRELTRQDCKICFNEVKLDRGSYSCRKPGCNYVVHVNCVLEDERLYKVIKDEKQCEELEEKSMQSSIIRVIDVNEAGEATKIQHFSHQHCLVLAEKMEEEIDRKCDGEKCNGCGANINKGAFRCGKCRFALDFGCLTLPHSALHKIDEHKLKLTYHDDKEQSYCDICEQYRDPSLWYYSCSICDTSAHPKCVLGQFSFLKDGVTFPFYYHTHPHNLKVFRKVEGFRECSRYGKLCQEEILKCENSTCNYIVHNKYKCRWGD
ncbi:hypothetical protein GOBAR_DD22728 [Gossypium barbadense]|nr:hypothetical protein GOBAR_DD22728 [Gossypium barbadense]